MISFPSASYIRKQHIAYIEKQKRDAKIRDKRGWYKIPKDCRDRLLKEIRNSMHSISKSDTTSCTIDFNFSLSDLGFSYPRSDRRTKITEEIIHYFVNSFNTRMYEKDKDNKDVKHFWQLHLVNENFKEFLKHSTGYPLKMLLRIEQYKDKGTANADNN